MAKRAERQRNATPAALRIVVGGGGLSLVASALISFEGLTGLGRLVDINPPWLLPLAIDIYAVTSTIVALVLPTEHHARRTAVTNAVLGLVLSMAGNAAERGLTLGWSGHDIVLMVAGACPSLIVERLMHLQGAVARRPPIATVVAPDAGATAVAATVAVATPSVAAVAKPQPALAAAIPQPATAAPPVQRAAPAPAATSRPKATTPAAGTKRVAINDVVLALLAEHGTEEGQVTCVMVGEAIGAHKTTGHRHLVRVRKELASGKLRLAAPAMSSSLSSSPTPATAMTP